MPEVAIEGGALVVVRREQALEVAQVLAKPVRRHRRVLPALVRLVLPRGVSGGAESLLPHVPEAVLGRGVVEVGDVRAVVAAGRAQVIDEGVRLVRRLTFARAAELDHQPARPLRQRVGRQVLLAFQRDERVVEALYRQRVVLGHLRHHVRGLRDAGIPEDHQRPARRDVDQADLGAQHRH